MHIIYFFTFSQPSRTRPLADKPLADQPIADRNKPLADRKILNITKKSYLLPKILFITKKIHIINPYKKLITNEKKRESLSIANFKKKFYPSHLEKISQRQKLHKKRKLIKFIIY
jgi:hypothetical protein